MRRRLRPQRWDLPKATHSSVGTFYKLQWATCPVVAPSASNQVTVVLLLVAGGAVHLDVLLLAAGGVVHLDEPSQVLLLAAGGVVHLT